MLRRLNHDAGVIVVNSHASDYFTSVSCQVDQTSRKAILLVHNVRDCDVCSNVLRRQRYNICCANKDASQLLNASTEVGCSTTSVITRQSLAVHRARVAYGPSRYWYQKAVLTGPLSILYFVFVCLHVFYLFFRM